MSEVNFYGQRGQLIKSWQFSIEKTKEGLWTGTQTYYCHRDDLAALLPGRGTAHPAYSFLKLDEASANGMEGDWMDIKAKYAGAGPAEGEFEFDDEDESGVYSNGVRQSTVEEPVATSAYFDEIPERDRNEAVKLATQPPKNKDGSAKKIDTTGWEDIPAAKPPGKGSKLELFRMVAGGLVSVLEPRVEYFQRYVATKMPTDLADIGKRKLVKPAGAPTQPADRDWLFTGYNIIEKAPKVFDIEKNWLLSGPGGWNDKLYDAI